MGLVKLENGASLDDNLDNAIISDIISEMIQTYVIDASVVIKWFSDLNENDLDKANLIRNDYLNKKIYLIAPDILIAEISNALSYNPNFDYDKTSKAIESLYLLDIKFIRISRKLIEESVILRYEKNITIYDALYLSLSKLLKIQLITADNKLIDKVKDIGNVVFLSDYSSF